MLKNIIEKLQQLNEDNFTVDISVEPIVECFETLLGDGIEETKYIYKIELSQKEPYRRKYKNKFGIKEYYTDLADEEIK